MFGIKNLNQDTTENGMPLSEHPAVRPFQKQRDYLFVVVVAFFLRFFFAFILAFFLAAFFFFFLAAFFFFLAFFLAAFFLGLVARCVIVLSTHAESPPSRCQRFIRCARRL